MAPQTVFLPQFLQMEGPDSRKSICRLAKVELSKIKFIEINKENPMLSKGGVCEKIGQLVDL
jgi:hypothetical protein